MSRDCDTVNLIVSFIIDVYDTCFYNINKRVRTRNFYISLNGNVHRLLRIRYIDRNIASISFLRDLVIAAFGDFHARSGDRRGRFRVFLRSYAIFRRTPPQSKCIDRKDRCHHACRKHCTDEPHLLFFHPQNLCFLLNFTRRPSLYTQYSTRILGKQASSALKFSL